MLQAGKSVVFCPDAARAIEGVSITSDKARTSAIVPILVDGEYVGVIGFDDWQRVREFDSSIVSALEIAAGLVGAALHRERLVETMRRERELAAEERLSSARRAPTPLLRANLMRLARDAGPAGLRRNILHRRHAPARRRGGLRHRLRQGRQSLALLHPRRGRQGRRSAAFQVTATPEETRIGEVLEQFTRAVVLPARAARPLLWPGVADWHAREGHKSAYLLPLVFGEQHRRAASAWCSARTRR